MCIVFTLTTCVCLTKGKTVTLKIKLVTFEVKTRAQSISHLTNDGEEIFKVASGLLKAEMKLCHPKLLHLRLMGMLFSSVGSYMSAVSQKLFKIFEKCDDESWHISYT